MSAAVRSTVAVAGRSPNPASIVGADSAGRPSVSTYGMLLFVSVSLAATLTVGSSGAYSTINSAISAAQAGDVVEVQPGVYAETPTLAGKNITLVSRDGPWTTTIAASAEIVLDSGTFEGFTLSPAYATAVSVASGSPTIRELVIQGPSDTGVSVTGGTPIVEEVVVYDAGTFGFRVRAGTPTLNRLVSVDAGFYGLQINGATSAANLLTIGGYYGFSLNKSGLVVSNAVVLDATVALAVVQPGTMNNSVFEAEKHVAQCLGGVTTSLTHSLAPAAFTALDCDASILSAISAGSAGFERWTSGTSLYEIDLQPAVGSAMINAGTGTDIDGSTADIGLFGGARGAWRDRDGDGIPVLFDCDDHDAGRYFGAVERADGVDDNCNGLIDDDVPIDTGEPPDTGDTGGEIDTGTVGEDIDGDGYPSPLDCGDHNIATYPGAPERLDATDNNCDGLIDDGTAGGDDDGDGYTELSGDCDDTNPARHPGAAETDRDGVDDDCNGVDENPRGQDNDNDGYTDASDCDDTNPSVHPNAADPTNGIDDDCDGLTDDDELGADSDGDGVTPSEGDCDDRDPALSPGQYDIPDDFIDQDCSGEDNFDVDRDGYASPLSGGEDCADTLSTVFPGAPESCTDSYDNDCDDEINEDCDEAGGGGESTDCAGCSTGNSAGLVAVAASLWMQIRRSRRNVS